ncbi:MAG: thiamine-phosphate kinase [Pseudomonadota bacterium]
MRETDWIDRYIRPLVTAPGAAALADDVALLSTPCPAIATMDTLVENVHFLASDPLDTVGQKLIRVNVSDILAKGAKPAELLLSIAWPRSRSEEAFSVLMQGVARDLEAYDVALIGGDFVATEGPLTLSATLTGHCFSDAPIRRSGGAAGQKICLHGDIGWGGLGLQAARNGGDPIATQRYRVPKIGTVGVAKIIAERASASMDVSDGLLIDLARLADASGCGADLDLDCIPLAKASENIDEIIAQCTYGDDYAMLVCAAPEREMPGFQAIGRLVQGGGLHLKYRSEAVKTPSTLGFEHTN